MDIYRQLIKSALARGNWTTFHLFSFFEHYWSSLPPRFPLPKNCTHHLSHNNNNLFSHIRKKRKNCKQTLGPISMRVHARRRQTYPHVSTGDVCCASGGMDGRGLRDVSQTDTHTLVHARTFSHSLTHVRCVTHTCTHTDTCRPFPPPWYCISFPFDVEFVFGCRGSVAAEESDVV